jgi:hypothetical protein
MMRLKKWLETKSILDDIYLEEEKYWHEKSRDQWLKDGDSNISYFHRITSNRKKKILILNLEIEGQMSYSLPQIEQHIIKFYKTLFGERHVQQALLYDNFWDSKYLVHEQAKIELEKHFTISELKEAVFWGQMHLGHLDLMGLLLHFTSIFGILFKQICCC